MIFSTILLIGIFLFMIGVMVCGFIFYKIATKYDFKCDVFEESNGAPILILESEKIKIVKKKGEKEKWIIKGWRSIKPFQPFGTELLIPILKKNVRKVYLCRDGHGEFHIIGFDFDETKRQITMKPWYRDGLDWGVDQLEEREKLNARKDWVSQNLPLWVSIVALMVIVMVLVFMPKWVGEQMSVGVKANVEMMQAGCSRYSQPAVVQQIPTPANNNLEWTQTVVPI